MNLVFTARSLIRFLEVQGLIALLGTKEVNPLFLLTFIGLAFTLWILSFRIDQKSETESLFTLNDRIILWVLGTIIVGSMVAIYHTQFHPLIIASYATPLISGVIWMSVPTIRIWTWRLGISLIQVILAVSMSPALYLAGVLFIYVISGAVALSCLFMWSEFSAKSVENIRMKLPSAFFTYSTLIAFSVFTLSLLIFPILPRPNTVGGWGRKEKSQVGYTEEVNLTKMMSLAGSGEGAPVLRIILPEEGDQESARSWIPSGLLKGKSLDIFTGSSWEPFPINQQIRLADKKPPIADFEVEPGIYQRGTQQTWVLEYLREPMPSGIIPTPYGVRNLHVLNLEGQRGIYRLYGNEWMAPVTNNRRIRYRVEQGVIRFPFSPPKDVHLKVPKLWRDSNSVFQKLAKDLTRNAFSDEEKIRKIRDHFMSGFRGSTDNTPTILGTAFSPSTTNTQKAYLNLETFLTRSKQGHCELFATSTALLLRLANVPSRLVAGFRVLRSPTGGIITIRQGDAHAWVEAWVQNRGWVPIDPSPMELGPAPGIIDKMRELKDFITAQWFRYIVTFDSSSQKEITQRAFNEIYRQMRDIPDWKKYFVENLLSRVVFGTIAIIALAILWFLIRSGRLKIRLSSLPNYMYSRNLAADLSKRRKKMNRLLKRFETQDYQSLKLSESARLAFENWYKTDERLRFGPNEPGSNEWDSGIEQLDILWGESISIWNEELESFQKEKDRAA